MSAATADSASPPPKRRWLQYRLRTLLLITALLAVALSLLCAWPRSCPLFYSDHSTGHFRGLGLLDGPGLLGRSFFSVTWVEAYGPTEFTFSGRGWNHFRGTYPDGSLREEGECWVDLNGSNHPEPLPDTDRVKWGKYYNPQGKLISEIKDGTGVQTYWMPDGTKIWELELKDYERVHLSMWYENGQLHEIVEYLEGKQHGPYVSYYPSGRKQGVGTYAKGHRIEATHYKEDGSVDWVEQRQAGEDGQAERLPVDQNGSGSDQGK